MPSDSLDVQLGTGDCAQAWRLVKPGWAWCNPYKTMGQRILKMGSPVPAPAGSDSLPDPAAGATSSLPAADVNDWERC